MPSSESNNMLVAAAASDSDHSNTVAVTTNTDSKSTLEVTVDLNDCDTTYIDNDIEYTLLSRRDVNAFQVPPRTSSGGYRAEDWKTCMWSGKLTVVAKGKDSIIRLLNTGTNELYLQSVIENGDYNRYVDRTLDSSRYFVVKVVHPKTKKIAYIGFGFEDRNDAFDFNCALSDCKNSNAQCDGGIEIDESILKAHERDYTLKEGEKITINLDKVNLKSKSATNKSENITVNTGSIGFLPPPPTATKTRVVPPPPDSKSEQKKSEKSEPEKIDTEPDPFEGDDFFGDFQSAS